MFVEYSLFVMAFVIHGSTILRVYCFLNISKINKASTEALSFYMSRGIA